LIFNLMPSSNKKFKRCFYIFFLEQVSFFSQN
jgi:hypothetical protein